MALCRITGIVYLPSGEIAARREVTFVKEPDSVTADYLGAVLPEPIRTRTDNDGSIDLTLITGNYYGFVLGRGGHNKYTFRAIVPESTTSDFADLIAAVDPVEPLPSWLQQVIQARDEAVAAESAAADSASDAADSADLAAALTAESPQTWAEFAAFSDYADGKLVTFNGVQFERDSTANIAGLPTGAGWRPSDPVSFEHFGTVGDGVTDDTTAMNAALASFREVSSVGGKTYLLQGQVNGTGSYILDFADSTIVQDSNTPAFRLTGRVTGPYPLTADYVPGSTTLNVAIPAAEVVSGSVIRVASNAQDPYNRYLPSGSMYRSNEPTTVGATVGADSVSLAAPLRFTEGVTPGVRGDLIPAYTVAQNARVVVYQGDTLRLRGGFWLAVPGAGRTAQPASISGYNSVDVETEVLATNGAGISSTGNMGGNWSVRYPAGSADYGNPTTGGFLNYDISYIGGRESAFTTTGSTIAANSTTMQTLIASGRVVGVNASGTVRGQITMKAFDFHSDATDCVIENALAMDCNGIAFQARGTGAVFRNIKARNCLSGLSVLTESQSGNYNAGGNFRFHTTATLDTFDIEARNDPFTVNASYARIIGVNRVASLDSRMLYVYGSVVDMHGDTTLTMSPSGAVRSNTGGIDVTGSAEALTYGLSAPTLNIYGNVTVDLRNAPPGFASLFGLRTVGAGQVNVYGSLTLLCPAGVTSVMGSNNVKCRAGGRVYFSIEGEAGSARDHVGGNTSIRLASLDGTYNYNDIDLQQNTPVVNALTINRQMGFEFVSNTSLRVKVRGTDGVSRSGLIALT